MNTENAATELEKGNELLGEEKLEEAIAAYRREIELNPDISWSHHNLGEALAKFGQLEEAIAAYHRAIELNPDFSWSYHHLGDALAQQEKWEEAVVAFGRAIELNPEHFGTYCGLGQSFVKVGQLEEAIAAYQQAIQLNPDADWIQYRLGEVVQQRTQLDLEGAIASYRRTLEINPENLEVWQQLRETLVRLGQWEEAIASCQRICQLNSESVEAYHELASCLSRFTQQKLDVFRSNPDAGKIAINQLQSQKPGIDLYLLNDQGFLQATCHLNDRDFVQEVYRAYLKREPEESAKETWSKFIREGTLTRQGLIGEFRQSDEFKLLISYGNRESEIASHWQVIKISYEHLDEEIACYQQAIEISPNCDRSYYQLGEALAKMHKSAEAIDFYRKAFELNPNNLEAERKLPRIYDCFPFFNEIDLLKIRIEELKDVVDKFVLIEATKTHSGRPKPLYYKEFIQEFAEYQDKIIHHIVDDMPEVENNNRWPLENYQRDCIGRVLAAIKCNDEDIILVSDVDEIPRKEKISEAVDLLSKNEYVIFCHDMYRYDLEQFESEWWCGTVACKYKELKVRTATRVRRSDQGMWHFPTAKAAMFKQARMLEYPDIEKGGWHFTSMGNTASSYWYKVQSFAHPEVDITEELGIEYVKFEVCRTGLDDDLSSGEYYYACNWSEIEAKDLPIFLKNNAYKYRHFFPRKPTKFMQIHGDIEQAESRVKELQVEIGQAESNLKEIAGKYRQLGEALAKHGDWEGAIMAYRSFIELKPEVAEVYGQLGDALAKQGNRDEAIAAYSKARELAPEADEIHNKLEALQQQKLWDLEAAIASYSRAIDLNPDDVQAYRKLLQIQPDNFAAWLQLGKALVKQEQLEEAIAAYRHACQLNPDSFDSYWQLGKNFYQQRLLKLKKIQSHPDVEATLLGECQSQSRQVPLNQLNDAGFVKATSILNDEDLIRELYRAYLKREAEPTAISSYSEILRSGGLTRLTILSSFRDSAEFKLLSIRYKDREYEIFAHWQAIEISYDNLAEEIACYRRAIELCPNSYECYWNLGEALARQGDATEAIAAYQKAVQIGMLLGKENRLEESLSCYQKALETIPDQFTIYSDLGILLVRLGLFEKLLACYHEAFKLSPNSGRAYHNLGLLLAQHNLIDDAVTFFQQAPQIQRSTEWDICEQIWQELHQLNPIDEANSFDQIEIELADAEEYFTLTSQYKILTLQSLTEADNKYLAKVGLSLPSLELIAQNNWDLEEIYINSFGDLPQEHLATKINLSLPYQQVLVETGYVYSLCPFSGKVLRSNQSFVINHYERGHHDLQGFIYRFVGSEIFYFMVGCVLGDKLLVYVPRLELIINLNAALVGFAPAEESINKLKSYMVSCWKQVKSYITTEKKKVVDVVGLGFNIGHYLWQDVTGIDVIYKNGLSQNMDIIVGDGEYFSIEEIIPEIPPHNQIHVKDVWDAFKTVLDNNYVAFRANGLFIEEKLINRLCEASFKKCEETFLNEVEIAKQHFPLLAVQIRTSSRVWLGQAEGIGNIIKSLYSDFPNLGVVFDGWSLTGNEDSLSVSWSMIESEKAIRKEILALIPDSIDTYSAIGATTYETVVWAKAIDLHISPVGAGLIYPVWIAHKPGVLYAHTQILNDFGKYYCATSTPHIEKISSQVLIPNDSVVDYTDCNYDCDWQAIYNEVLKILKQLNDKK